MFGLPSQKNKKRNETYVTNQTTLTSTKSNITVVEVEAVRNKAVWQTQHNTTNAFCMTLGAAAAASALHS